MFAGFLDFNWIPGFMQGWTFIIIMAVVLIGLLGLLMFLRSKQAEED